MWLLFTWSGPLPRDQEVNTFQTFNGCKDVDSWAEVTQAGVWIGGGNHYGETGSVASNTIAGTVDLSLSSVIVLVLKSCFIPFSFMKSVP